MTVDDDEDCAQHRWRLTHLTATAEEGAHTVWLCEECGGLLLVPPGAAQPDSG